MLKVVPPKKFNMFHKYLAVWLAQKMLWLPFYSEVSVYGHKALQ